MAHALAVFIRKRMDERKLRQRDIVAMSGLTRAVVSKYAIDERETLGRLPEKETIDGLAKGLGTSPEFLLAKAIESLGIGYTAGDFINSVATASDRELLDEIEQRLLKRGGERADGSAPKTEGEVIEGDFSRPAPLSKVSRRVPLTQEELDEQKRRAQDSDDESL